MLLQPSLAAGKARICAWELPQAALQGLVERLGSRLQQIAGGRIQRLCRRCCFSRHPGASTISPIAEVYSLQRFLGAPAGFSFFAELDNVSRTSCHAEPPAPYRLP